ncbi:unnamed protein product [Vitrella brassicaformis CCMP3155]|uniref:FPL domain-containing protein n=1 Tax=Vitrella brassicaformis (strain CCMP3155) TaxID=1169540 RepID=A0A0G4FXJ3_VITBC|nr:unnamed protein product [Vitrella brassicaformis CCMP3155]|eukprot:CEM20135.1 unnamed protein product [Vitrella brassicaformis CCMP3155]
MSLSVCICLELLFALQQQPLYLTRLVQTLTPEEDNDMTAVSQHMMLISNFTQKLYLELDTSRVNHLFLAFLRLLGEREISETGDLDFLFVSEYSLFMDLFTWYNTHPANIPPLIEHIVNVFNPNSLAAVLSQECTEPFRINPTKYEAPLAQDMAATAQRYYAELQYFMQHMPKAFLQSAAAACWGWKSSAGQRGLVALMHGLVVRKWEKVPMVATQGGAASDSEQKLAMALPILSVLFFCMWNPLLKADRDQLLASCGYPHFVEALQVRLGRVAGSLEEVSTFMEMFVMKDYKVAVLAPYIAQATTVIIDPLLTFVDDFCSMEDTLDVDLTVGIYLSHYDLKRHFVTMEPALLAGIVNLLALYEDQVAIAAYDRVYQLVREIADGREPPFSAELLQRIEMDDTAYNFQIHSRFLLEHKNLMFCPVSRCPVPQQLAPRQLAYTHEGNVVVSPLLRYVAPDPREPRVLFVRLLLDLPAVESYHLNFVSFAKELQSMRRVVLNRQPPDYNLAERISDMIEHLKLMREIPGAGEAYALWLLEDLKTRRKFYNYMQKVNDEEVSIKFIAVRGAEKAQEGEVAITQDPTITWVRPPFAVFPYRALHKQTVVRLLPGEKFDYKKVRRISFVFKCTSADSWLRELKRAGKAERTFADGGVTFVSHRLVKLLGQNLRGSVKKAGK